MSMPQHPMYSQVLTNCSRIVSMSGNGIDTDMQRTQYVIDGQTYSLKIDKDAYNFWLGINGPRLFFIAYVASLTTDDARRIFAFTFGGAAKAGWEVNYEAIEGGVSIWATCMTDRGIKLVDGSTLSDYGDYWATDIAMMAQSWLRTSQRHKIPPHLLQPAPL